jgi:hypothetical protein
VKRKRSKLDVWDGETNIMHDFRDTMEVCRMPGVQQEEIDEDTDEKAA